MIRQPLLIFFSHLSILFFINIQVCLVSFSSIFTHLFSWLHLPFFFFLILTLHLHVPYSSCFLICHFSHHHSLLQLLPFILTPNGLSLINIRVLYSLSHSLPCTHARSVLRSLLCRLNAEGVIPWIKYKER